MNLYDIEKAYVSPYDEFLAKFDQTHPPSASQLKEIKTYQRITALRDYVQDESTEVPMWQEF